MAKRRSSRLIELGAEPTIRDVARLHEQLVAALRYKTAVTLDGAAVTRVDTAVLQVLLAFVNSRAEVGRAVALRASDDLLEALRLLDLQPLLACTDG